jgi:hypothetical protein
MDIQESQDLVLHTSHTGKTIESLASELALALVRNNIHAKAMELNDSKYLLNADNLYITLEYVLAFRNEREQVSVEGNLKGGISTQETVFNTAMKTSRRYIQEGIMPPSPEEAAAHAREFHMASNSTSRPRGRLEPLQPRTRYS